MFRRRSALVALIAAFALVAAACAGTATTTTTTTQPPVQTTTTAPPQTTTTAETTTTTEAPMAAMVGMAYDIGGRGDLSFNDAAARGLDQAVADFGIEVQELEPTAGGENREENLRLLAEAGFELVLAIGFAFTGSVDAAAGDFADTSFGIIDAVVGQPNVSSLVFAEEQGSFLVGAAAALKSQTKTIGFIGGVDIDLIRKFEAGFVAGVEAVDPNIQVLVTYLTVPPDFSGFADSAKGKEAALAQFQQGADIVYHAAGGSGAGLFEAAKEVSESTGSKVWAIGVDSDQYQTAPEDQREYILTSMLKRVDVAVYETIKDFVEGNFTAGVRVFDLSVDGVGYSTSGGFVDDIVDELEVFKTNIVNGDIVVPTLVGG